MLNSCTCTSTWYPGTVPCLLLRIGVSAKLDCYFLNYDVNDSTRTGLYK